MKSNDQAITLFKELIASCDSLEVTLLPERREQEKTSLEVIIKTIDQLEKAIVSIRSRLDETLGTLKDGK